MLLVGKLPVKTAWKVINSNIRYLITQKVDIRTLHKDIQTLQLLASQDKLNTGAEEKILPNIIMC